MKDLTLNTGPVKVKCMTKHKRHAYLHDNKMKDIFENRPSAA
jgi:hypothetical protein